MLQERDGSLAKTAQYTDWPGFSGGLASQRRGVASSFYGFDSQASTRVLVAVGGTVTDSYSFRAFGEELAAGSGTVNPFRYVGQYGYYHDAAARLYVRARHFVVTAGRWTGRDPVDSVTFGENLYGYVNNGPLTFSDPSGLQLAGPVLPVEPVVPIEPALPIRPVLPIEPRIPISPGGGSTIGAPPPGLPFCPPRFALPRQRISLPPGNSPRRGSPSRRRQNDCDNYCLVVGERAAAAIRSLPIQCVEEKGYGPELPRDQFRNCYLACRDLCINRTGRTRKVDIKLPSQCLPGMIPYIYCPEYFI